MRQTDPQLVEKIKALRQQGCTILQIADEVGMSQGHISRLLRKHASTPPMPTSRRGRNRSANANLARFSTICATSATKEN